MSNRLNDAVRVSFILAVVGAFIRGPAIAIGSIDIRIFDLIFLVLFATAVFYFISNSQIRFAVDGTVHLFAIVYLWLAILLPVLGVVVYGNPIHYFVGDLRWVQVYFIGAVAISYYGSQIKCLDQDLLTAMKLTVLIHTIVFSLQFVDYLGVVLTKPLLAIWYHGVPAYGDYGYWIGRFAGAAAYSSGLGLVAAVGIAVFGKSILITGRNVGYLMISLVLLIASGHRTSIVAAVGVAGVLGTYYFIYGDNIGVISIKSIALGICTTILLAVIYIFNVGRVASSDRYSELIGFILSPRSLLKQTGRADAWAPILSRAEQYRFGTLSNPSWVFEGVSAIDSYFVIVYVQGGVFYLAAYLTFLVSLVIASVRLVSFKDESLLTLSLASVMTAHSLTQNFMTDISGKLLAILSIVLVVCIYGSIQRTQ